jgi:replicative DNA helicase
VTQTDERRAPEGNAPPPTDLAAQPIDLHGTDPLAGLPVLPNAERALLACLLHLDAASAARVTAIVRPNDLASPALAELLAAVTALAYMRTDPEPCAVLSVLRDSGRANGTNRVQLVGRLLADLYVGAPVPASAVFYAATVLHETTRRRAREAGERVAQAAELVPIADLPELVVRELSAVLALTERSLAIR